MSIQNWQNKRHAKTAVREELIKSNPMPMQTIAFQELALVRLVLAITLTLPTPYNVLEGRPNILITKFLIL